MRLKRARTPGGKEIKKFSQLILPQVFLGDDAFGRKSHMMKPYPWETDHRVFNYRLSRTYRIIENVFGRNMC